jgi:hypothetical protein
MRRAKRRRVIVRVRRNPALSESAVLRDVILDLHVVEQAIFHGADDKAIAERFENIRLVLAALLNQAARGVHANPGVFRRVAAGVRAGVHGAVASSFAKRRDRALATLTQNPPLVVFGNPPKGRIAATGDQWELMSNDVCEIRYKHAGDGKYYKHKFRKGQVQLVSAANSPAAMMRRVDGKPLIREY